MLRFALVGVAAFFVDAVVLYLAVKLFHFSPYTGRALSFFAAASAAWAMNRRCTFSELAGDDAVSEWGRYIAVNGLGAMLNLGVYAVLVASISFAYRHPIFAVAAGSLAGMAANYSASKRLVFTGARAR